MHSRLFAVTISVLFEVDQGWEKGEGVQAFEYDR